MNHRKKKEIIEDEYKTALEKFYDKHIWYRHLVFLSRIARMSLYLLLGFSVIFLVVNGGQIKTFESLVYDLVQTSWGKFVALAFAFLLIIYGIEKPRG